MTEFLFPQPKTRLVSWGFGISEFFPKPYVSVSPGKGGMRLLCPENDSLSLRSNN